MIKLTNCKAPWSCDESYKSTFSTSKIILPPDFCHSILGQLRAFIARLSNKLQSSIIAKFRGDVPLNFKLAYSGAEQ